MSITEIIARLGHACGLPWARCVAVSGAGSGPSAPGARCCMHRGHGVMHESYDRGGVRWVGGDVLPPLPPTLAEWAAEWEREHEHPGPVAEYGSDETPVWWSVEVLHGTKHRPESCIYTRIRCGTVEAHHNGRRWGGLYVRNFSGVNPADVLELGRLMQAVDGAP